MARGWESKSIEAQQEEAARRRASAGHPSPEARLRATERQTIELAIARATADLARATAPAHRRMLEAALAALGERLRALDIA